ncbi:MAG: hypothetical protein ACRCVJ_07250 [Clostridium sp.]|uniref:hypothetical protein n=1 Tax=Clostridium sp. TaxID=1506 RepID=UPI003F3A8FAD
MQNFHSLADDINLFLLSNKGESFTSEEIDSLINSVPYNNLKTALASCNKSEFTDPVHHIDTVCSYLSKKRLLKQIKKHSDYDNRDLDAFTI